MEQTNAGGNPTTVEPAQNADNSPQPILAAEAPKVETPVIQPIVQNEQPKAEQPRTEEAKKPSSFLNTEDTQTALTDELRQKLSKGDEKAAKFLTKFKTMDDMVTSYRELESKFHKTRGVPELAKDATPEQVKEYREQAGIPESWEKYDTELDGVNIGEQDKPIVDDFLKRAHDRNLRPAEVKNALQAYFEVATQRNKEFIEKAQIQTAEVQKHLQKEWGNAFDANKNMIVNHLQQQLGDDFGKLNEATLSDGTLLINNPKLLNYFLSGAKSGGQSHTMLPNSSDPISLSDRAKEIEKLQKENPGAFYNNPKLSEEYNQIHHALKQLKNS